MLLPEVLAGSSSHFQKLLEPSNYLTFKIIQIWHPCLIKRQNSCKFFFFLKNCWLASTRLGRIYICWFAIARGRRKTLRQQRGVRCQQCSVAILNCGLKTKERRGAFGGKSPYLCTGKITIRQLLPYPCALHLRVHPLDRAVLHVRGKGNGGYTISKRSVPVEINITSWCP